MSVYIAELRARTAAIEARQAEEQRAKERAVRERFVPLEQRLARLLATIPPALQAEGIPLASLQAQLKGRWRGSAHPGEVGKALRSLGFTRERRWRGGAVGFQAVWRKQG